jgi:hypothetical protein
MGECWGIVLCFGGRAARRRWSCTVPPVGYDSSFILGR